MIWIPHSFVWLPYDLIWIPYGSEYFYLLTHTDVREDIGTAVWPACLARVSRTYVLALTGGLRVQSVTAELVTTFLRILLSADKKVF